jgi:PAS domain S-box-containing protein
MALGASNIVFNTGEPAYAVDRNGRIVAWNAAASDVFGYPEDTALDVNCWELLRGRDVFGNRYCVEHCPHREMALRRQTINRFRMQFRNASGQYGEYSVSAIALFEKAGGEFLIHLCRPIPAAGEEVRAEDEPAGAGSSSGVLTARETEVLQNLEQGHSTRKIAETMGISIPTVRNHVEHVLQKLQCHSRLEAVAAGRRLKLL